MVSLPRIPSFPRRRESLCRPPPTTFNNESRCRVWQRRFYGMNIWTEKMKLEKLNGGRHNPVKRRLMREPDEWEWPSWNYYYLNNTSLLEMDRIP